VAPSDYSTHFSFAGSLINPFCIQTRVGGLVVEWSLRAGSVHALFLLPLAFQPFIVIVLTVSGKTGFLHALVGHQ
jgi:hypothetical protein